MSLLKFKIPRRSRKCLHCESSFKELPKLYSIIKGDEEEPIREDYCAICFQNESVLSDSVWGYWESSLKKTKKNLSVDQRALDLFIEKYEEGEKEWLYFLAHYLKRKKQLITRSEIKKEGILFFEDPISSEIYSIENVVISNAMLSTLKERFLQALIPQSEVSSTQ